MEELCTCGARLVPDARFCHKCGRPVREPEETSEPPAVPIEPPPAAHPPAAEPVGFHDGRAIRIGLLAGALALLFSSIPISPWLPMIALLAGGAFAVYLYNRSTGQCLPVRSGLRLGWMTGLFAFVISMVLMTIALALLSGHQEALERALREQSGLPPEVAARVLEVVRNPLQLGLSLLFGFVSFSLAAALGGAVGARIFRKH
ncbi:MAG: hypothetical protein ACP5U2_00745 [Bryobacteraceae bacterium]